jgi:transposase
VRVAGVEPMNNAAERTIRPGVLWRTGSFRTQSADGSRVVETMTTVVATLRHQHRNVLAYLTDAYQAAYTGAPAPSLLPCRPEAEEDLPIAA